MLFCSHLVAGAAVGLAVDRPLPRTVAALGTHLVLDGVGHDDETLGPLAQAALGLVTLATLAACCGPVSSPVLGAIAGGVPDTEVAVDMVLFGGRIARYAFPSHWQIRRQEKPTHPYRFPGPGLPIAAEIALATAGLALISAVGLRRRLVRTGA